MKKWFSWLAPARGSVLGAAQLARRAALPPARAADNRPLREQRFVVLDLETTGLNVNRDKVLSIGAVVIEDGDIDLGSQYECTMQQDHQVSESILIHGLAPSTIAAGLDPAEALLDFMQFLGDSPVLGYHAPFDQRMLSRALREVLDYDLRHSFIDLAEVAPMLFPKAGIHKGGLDAWVKYFGLQVLARHSASADALVTAELALILFNRAQRQGIDSLASLQQQLHGWRRRQQHSF
ncbi:3'-5' exonuclease [Pseudomonas sp. N040]|uniref:3'-5' exonuclease n=1 Tax=Pseudomonas sp. N040 TaxID=2785325 RepID=UPI0018A30122|nr:3'-5' exonuclease [Pseudomonas sp. N040]MBF7731532.1 3'-5' exonuclease [Pseudomonas sp. N040]MBW7015176.1 3'-5' exonuclease [Pseudomonas sp. N040]